MVVSFRKHGVVKKTNNSPAGEIVEGKLSAPFHHKLLLVITQDMNLVFCYNTKDRIQFKLQVDPASELQCLLDSRWLTTNTDKTLMNNLHFLPSPPQWKLVLFKQRASLWERITLSDCILFQTFLQPGKRLLLISRVLLLSNQKKVTSFL